jgi:hypothetical protein
MKYLDVVIEASDVKIERDADKSWRRRFKVRVLGSPAGDMTPDQAVLVQCNEKDLQERLRGLDRRELDRDGLLALGRLLGLLLLPPAHDGAAISVRELFSHSLDRAVQEEANLRMRLRLPPELAAIPWEYLCLDRVGTTDGMDGFLALDPRVAIVRHEALPIPAPPPRATGDITVLAALASPLNLNLDSLDLDREERDLQEALSQQAGIRLKVLKDATLNEVQKALPDTRVFHFAGHAMFQQQSGGAPGTVTGAGALALDDGLVDAVGDEGVGVLARSHRRNVDDNTGALKAHDRQYVLACHDCAAQVDRADAVEGLLAQFVQRLVATPNADPDIVVQDINAAPARPSRLHRGGERLFLGHVGGEGHALATLRRHRSGLLGGGDKPVDGQDPGAFLREAERRRAAIADPLTGALAGPDDHSDLAFETHGSTPCNRCSRMPLWCLPSQVCPGVLITCLSHPLSSMRAGAGPRSRTGSVGSLPAQRD